MPPPPTPPASNASPPSCSMTRRAVPDGGEHGSPPSSASGTQRAATAVLGLATGSTPVGVYRELIRLHRERRASPSRRVVTFNLDEYYPMDRRTASTPITGSCGRTSSTHVNIDPANIHIPDGDAPRERGRRPAASAYEAAIRAAGGIDFQLLGIGRTGPHRLQRAGLGRAKPDPARSPSTRSPGGMPPPTSSAKTTCRARPSPWASPRSSRPGEIAHPGHRRAQGATIVRRAVEGEVDTEVAATFLQRHPNATFYLDGGRRRDLTRDGHAVAGGRGRVDATSSRMRAVIWLSPDRPARPCSSSTDERLRRAQAVRAGAPGAARRARSTASSSTRSAPGSAAARKLPHGRSGSSASRPHPDDDVI